MGKWRRLQALEIFLGTMVNSKSVTVTCLESHVTELGSAGEVVFRNTHTVYTIVPRVLGPPSLQWTLAKGDILKLYFHQCKP